MIKHNQPLLAIIKPLYLTIVNQYWLRHHQLLQRTVQFGAGKASAGLAWVYGYLNVGKTIINHPPNHHK